MKYLQYNEYVPHAPDTVGRTVRLPHETDECTGSSKSLAVWRTEDDVIHGYCHRCSKRGSYRKAFSTALSSKSRENGKGDGVSSHPVTNNKTIPKDSTGDVYEWAIKARVWATSRGITAEEVKRYGIVYSKYTNSIYLPIYSDENLAGYVCKPFNEGMPKYITRWNDRENALWINEIDDSKPIVLTEDILSAIVVGRYINTIALVGVNITTHQLAYLSKFDRFIIWLDNDNPQVKMKQLQARNKLSLFGDVRVIHTDRDPKYLSEAEIKEVLNENS